MNLFDRGLLDTPYGWIVALLVGLVFGFWLERAGFGSSRKLAAVKLPGSRAERSMLPAFGDPAASEKPTRREPPSVLIVPYT